MYSLSLAGAREVDAICDRFEAALRAGANPEAADYVAQASPANRARVRDELTSLEADYRCHQAEPPSAGQPGAGPNTATAASCLRAPGAIVLTVVAGPSAGASFRFDRRDTFIVGRSKLAHLRMSSKDKYLSRHHFLLEINPPRCRLINLSTTNGTLINGQQVGAADLHDEDLILAGDTAIRVTIEATELAQDAASAAAGLDNAREPERLGPYQLLRELGSGGMGKVYLARHNATGLLYAVKTIQAPGTARDREVQRFLREASILKQLRHPAIVAYHDCGHARDRVFVGMEYVPGSDAAHALKQSGPFAVKRAARALCQTLEALDYAHAQGFVHRDVKPANLLLHQTLAGVHVKLADFGLARTYHASTLSGLTLTGDMGGSLPFLAPEQLTNYRHADPRCDIYAAGATLYTLLTDRYIFDFPSRLADCLLLVLQHRPTDVNQHRSDLPLPLRQVIYKALARRPSERFASARDMQTALSPFA